MVSAVVKRDGRVASYDKQRITNAIMKCGLDLYDASRVTDDVEVELQSKDLISVEEIQDLVEDSLIKLGFINNAKKYIRYRNDRTRFRESKSDLTTAMFNLTYQDAVDSDDKRENANINADSPMGTMLKYGTTISKKYFLDNVISSRFAKAHRDGIIHVHDLDFYHLTETCCQIDLTKLFEEGFYSGHGFIRTPNSIGTYASLACIIIQANQNEMHK